MSYTVERAIAVLPRYLLYYLECSRWKECISKHIEEVVCYTDLHNQKIDHPTWSMQDGDVEPGSSCSVWEVSNFSIRETNDGCLWLETWKLPERHWYGVCANHDSNNRRIKARRMELVHASWLFFPSAFIPQPWPIYCLVLPSFSEGLSPSVVSTD